MPGPIDLRARLGEVRSLARLMPALPGLPAPVYLVGGAVRDMLRGADSVDLDLAVEGEAEAVAHALAGRLGGSATTHDDFGTATVRADGLAADLATTRRELYERPGALPTVERASLAEDLGRRDFTINAMAVGLCGDDLGALHDPHGGRADLDAGLIRVLHPSSFIDDPTRLLRALRYEARLGFALEGDTERLAREAAVARAPQTVSGARIRDELLDLLAEPEAPMAVARLAQLGLDSALHHALAADARLVESARGAAIETGARPDLTGLAALSVTGLGSPGTGLADWVEALALTRSERDAVLRAARRAPNLAEELGSPLRPSELHERLGREPAEALALALALGAPPEPILRYLADRPQARLEITGEDLLAAGVPESPSIGRALRETLRRKLDGELTGRDEELRTALALARENG
jgi:tRNA nucleotidyltransferase (CCA-adding enzyme)